MLHELGTTEENVRDMNTFLVVPIYNKIAFDVMTSINIARRFRRLLRCPRIACRLNY